jgi:aspartyl-tRNA(Asn)/glutamyl-tRNA(Gln) amidotransferase subunit C
LARLKLYISSFEITGRFPKKRFQFVIIGPMTLTIDEVNHIAALARLELTGEEKERYRLQLSAILEYAARLQAVDTSRIPPTSSVLPSRSVLRPDETWQPLKPGELLRNAPEAQDDQFRVPPVME